MIGVKELAALVGGSFATEQNEDLSIHGVASISEAGPNDITFLGNPKYLPALRSCRAGAVLVSPDFSESVTPIVIRVENPSVAFAQLVERFTPEPIVFPPGIHPTAVIGADVQLGEGVCVQANVVIEPGAKIGAGSVIGALSYIGHGARIGAGTLLHSRVTVGERCVVGDRVILHSGVVLGSDGFGFELVAGRHSKIRQVGIVQVDDDVEIGANTTIDRARFGRTWIQEGTKIDNLVQIAHNVVIGKHCLIVAQVGIAGSVRLGNYVTLAGQVGVAGHLEVGDGVVVSAQSGISKNTPAAGLYMGTPMVPAAEYRDQVVHVRRLPKLIARVEALEKKQASMESL